MGTTTVQLVKLKAVKAAFQKLGVASSYISQLVVSPTSAQSLIPSRAAQAVAAAPPLPIIPSQPFTFDKTAPNIQCNIPDTLLVLSLTQEEIKTKKYGLHTQPDTKNVMPSVTLQLASLEKWSITPIYLKRPLSFKMLATSTWEGIREEILRFLGYIKMFHGVQQPSLHHYLNGHLVASHVSFLLARGVKPQQLSDAARAAERVLVFLKTENMLSPADLQLFSAYQESLKTLTSQLYTNLDAPPSLTLAQQTQSGKWMDPDQLLTHIMRVEDEALACIHEVTYSPKAAKMVMHASYVGCTFGSIAPVRSSVVCSLHHPSYNGPCLHPDCQHPQHCLGNRLEWRAPQACSSNTTTRELWLVAPHHKSSRSKGFKGKPIECHLPSPLSDLMSAHLKAGRDLLLSCGEKKDSASPFVFFLVSNGEPISDARASQIFSKVVLPSGFGFGPQKARSIFITGSRAGTISNISEADAAHVMGNSLRMWEEVYDKNHALKTQAQNQQAIAKWRQEVKAKNATALAAAPSPTHAANSDSGCSSSSDGSTTDDDTPDDGVTKGMAPSHNLMPNLPLPIPQRMRKTETEQIDLTMESKDDSIYYDAHED